MKSFFLFLFYLNLFDKNFSKNYRLQDYDICANKPFKTALEIITGVPEIELGYGKDSVTIISQIWNASTIQPVKFKCIFTLKVHKRYSGIYVAITKLNFRTASINNRRKCIDYIEFSRGNKNNSPKICDQIGNGESEKIIFDDRRREIRVTIFVDDNIRIREPLELNMVFTSHGICTNSTEEFQCNEYDPSSCISNYFVNDNIPNCMNNCSDEGFCFSNVGARSDLSEKYNYSEIVLTAIVSLIFSLLIVGAILFTCYKYWNSCKPHERNETQNEFSVAQPEPSSPQLAPNDEIQEGYSKDLPPSYESLFPQR